MTTTKNEQEGTHCNANDATIDAAFDRFARVAELMVSGLSEWEARLLETSSNFEQQRKAGL